MKKFAFVLFATLCAAAPAIAQPSAGDDQGGGGKGGKGGVMKEAVQACRKQAMAQGLSAGTKEMRQAVTDCVVKDHPGMANVMKCRMDAMDKGMKPGSTDLKSYVKDCAKKSRGA